MIINSRQVNVLRSDTGGKYPTLKDYMERRKVMRMPWVETQEIAVSAANFVEVDSTTHLISGILAVLTASPPVTAITNGGICASVLAGATGSGADTHHTDDLGNILNLVLIRDAATHEEIKTAEDRTVFGLVQCALGTSEGANVGAEHSENTQLSFVYIAADGTLTLTAITATIEFQVNRLYMESHVPTIFLEGGSSDRAVVEPKVQEPLSRVFTVTTGFAANQGLILSTGVAAAGAGSGEATVTGDSVTLEASAALFNANNLVRVRLNGVQLLRGVSATWVDADQIQINLAMDPGDVLEVEVPIKYS